MDQISKSVATATKYTKNNFKNIVVYTTVTTGALVGGYYLYKYLTADNCKHLIVISGPSGVGKTTLIKRIQEEIPNVFGFCVSYTTRPRRTNETDGVDYHYITTEEMMKKIDNDDFVEWTEFAGCMYGTSRQSINKLIAEGKIIILDIDKTGVESLKKSGYEALYVAIVPRSVKDLERRLKARRTEPDAIISRRLMHAEEMILYANTPGEFDKVIINDQLDKAYEEFRVALGPLLEEYYKHGH